MQVHELKPAKGSRHSRKVVGRGPGSGHGKTSGRGEKGQRSRSGRWSPKAKEGGQMPLLFRLAKVGFNRPGAVDNQVVHLDSLNRFEKGQVVDAQALKAKGLISTLAKPFKILNKGEIKTALVIKGGAVSQSAKEKIEKSGGKVELIDKSQAPEKGAAAK